MCGATCVRECAMYTDAVGNQYYHCVPQYAPQELMYATNSRARIAKPRRLDFGTSKSLLSEAVKVEFPMTAAEVSPRLKSILVTIEACSMLVYAFSRA